MCYIRPLGTIRVDAPESPMCWRHRREDYYGNSTPLQVGSNKPPLQPMIATSAVEKLYSKTIEKVILTVFQESTQ